MYICLLLCFANKAHATDVQYTELDLQADIFKRILMEELSM